MKGFEFEPQTHYRFNCGYFLCDIKTFFEFYVTNSTFKGWKQKTRYKVVTWKILNTIQIVHFSFYSYLSFIHTMEITVLIKLLLPGKQVNLSGINLNLFKQDILLSSLCGLLKDLLIYFNHLFTS